MSKKDPTKEEWRDAYLELRKGIEALKTARVYAVRDLAAQHRLIDARRLLSKATNPGVTKAERRRQYDEKMDEGLTPGMREWATLHERISATLGITFTSAMQNLFASLRDTDERIHHD